MKTIAIIKQVEGQLVIELRDDSGALIDMFPVDEIKKELSNGIHVIIFN
jgi:hypothetical protein